ncbi:MAG: hypothetical protein L0Y44_10385 [Phycisphaerales bacterium]|nr:hypothetical protein [Phycisphaerales bacterium]
MKWSVFALFAFAFIVLQLSMRSVLTVQSAGSIAPDLIAALAAFITVFAHRVSALWACWLLGLAMDLSPGQQSANFHLLGPQALGYLFGGYVVLQLRTMVFRQRALTLGFLTFVCALSAGVVSMAILAVRSWYPGEPSLTSGAITEMAQRLGGAVYSGVAGIAVGWLLSFTIPLWGFHSGMWRRVRAEA